MPARTKSVRVVQGLTSDSGPAGTREVVANGTVSQPETLPSPPPPPLLNLVSRWLHFRGELHSLYVSGLMPKAVLLFLSRICSDL